MWRARARRARAFQLNTDEVSFYYWLLGGLEKATSVGRRAAITVHVLRRHGRVYFVAPVRECRPPRSPFSAASSDHHEARPLVLSALLLAGPMPVGRSLRVLVPAPQRGLRGLL